MMDGAAHPQARHGHHPHHNQQPQPQQPQPQPSSSAAAPLPSAAFMIPPQPMRMNGDQQPNNMRMMPIPNQPLPPFPHGRSPPNLDTNTKHVPCKFYPLGSCNAGDACKFSHNLERAQDRQPCKYFQKGNCKFGAKCALLHLIDGRLVNDPITQQLTIGSSTTGFQRQPPLPGGPQISGLSMGMQRLGPNQPPLPPTATNNQAANGFGYFGSPTSPTASEANHFQLSSQQNTPPSPPKYRSGLSSALRGQQDIDGYEMPKARTPNSLNLLGPLDAPFPASVDLTNNQFSRHGPFAASVPAKFGIPSNSASLGASMRERAGEYYPSSGTQTPTERGPVEFGSRYGSPIDATPWTQENFRSGNPLSSIQAARNHAPTSPHHSRPQSSSSVFTPFEPQKQNPVPPSSRVSQLSLQRARVATISSSVPAAHFGEKTPFSPVLIDEEALDPDALPSSLHDEVLLPQELNRRSSTSHAPGLNRRSSAYEEYARSPPSGAATPGSERGGTSLSGSPGSSRMEPIWAKLTDRESTDISTEIQTLSLNSRHRVASPLRNTVEPTYFPTRQQLPLKTPSVHAAQKWGGRTAEKLFPQTNGVVVPKEESHPVNVPGIVWRRTGEVVGTGRGELTKEEVMRIKEEEEGLEFSMDS